MNDDVVVEAEIVEGTELEQYQASPASSSMAPGDKVLVLSFMERQTIAMALAHYHDKGPRERNTKMIIETLVAVNSYESEVDCEQCNNTGKYRTMYAMEFCYCLKGTQRRKNEG